MRDKVLLTTVLSGYNYGSSLQALAGQLVLHELGYDSYVTIEREISGEQQEADIRYAKEYLESIVNEVYGG